jgi:hypothetical protein
MQGKPTKSWKMFGSDSSALALSACQIYRSRYLARTNLFSGPFYDCSADYPILNASEFLLEQVAGQIREDNFR